MSYVTRRLSELEFPMYFSLGSQPGYDISYLETCGIDGEYWLFSGEWSNSVWQWGGNYSIEGKGMVQSTSLGKSLDNSRLFHSPKRQKKALKGKV